MTVVEITVASGTSWPILTDNVLTRCPVSWCDASMKGLGTMALAAAMISPGRYSPLPPDVAQAEPIVTISSDLTEGGLSQMPPTLMFNSLQATAPVTQERFQEMVDDWFRYRGPTSNLAEMVADPTFRQIVAAGKESIPFLLQELKRRPSFLALALPEITGENPVPRAARGKINEMAKAWLAWGEKNGLL
jgi:hypothetical protein